MKWLKYGEYKKPTAKYWQHKVQYKGKWFDSTHERDRYIYLQHLEKQGKISNLRTQVSFELITQTTKTVPIQLKTKIRYDEKVVEQNAEYTCDFVYIENGKYICEEFKSEQTAKLADYVLRRKLMIKKMYAHNAKGKGQWIFREVVYSLGNGATTIEDK